MKRFFLELTANILHRIHLIQLFFGEPLERWRWRLLVAARGPTKTEIELLRKLESYDDFVNEPKALANTLTSANHKYHVISEIYFVLKTAVALYEAENRELPLQVHNEWRNALDHFIRSLIHVHIVFILFILFALFIR